MLRNSLVRGPWVSLVFVIDFDAFLGTARRTWELILNRQKFAPCVLATAASGTRTYRQIWDMPL